MNSSLYIGATGMISLSNGMNVVSNNIANISTVGYKQQSILFSDVFSSSLPMTSRGDTDADSYVGMSQKGHGVQVQAVRTLYGEGGFESSNTVTDLAVGGLGFYQVQNTETGDLFYTRAGNFRFSKDGDLLNPEGLQLMGWAIDDNGAVAGAASPIRVNMQDLLAPSPTTKVSLGANLNSRIDMSENAANPYFSLWSSWNGAASPPLSEGSYGYSSTISIYDAEGNLRDLTIYADRAPSSQGTGSTYEFVIGRAPDETVDPVTAPETVDPVTAPETGTDPAADPANPADPAVPDGPADPDNPADPDEIGDQGNPANPDNPADPDNPVNPVNPDDPAGRDDPENPEDPADPVDPAEPAEPVEPVVPDTVNELPKDGLFMAGTLVFNAAGQLVDLIAFTPDGEARDLASWKPAALADGIPQFTTDDGQTIGLDLGLSQAADTWTGAPENAAAVGADGALLGGMGAGVLVGANATTAYSGGGTATRLIRDGYGEGELVNLKILSDGTVRGVYSNMQEKDLYQIPLCLFTSSDGLRREGGNLFSRAPEAGELFMGRPETENFGTINAYNLETSNVDLPREMANMIITQRGFQANSKVVTTADALLQKAIELKR